MEIADAAVSAARARIIDADGAAANYRCGAAAQLSIGCGVIGLVMEIADAACWDDYHNWLNC
jgi:hypothetical protein